MKSIQQDMIIKWYRGYYMAAQRYEFYLQVLKVSLACERSEGVRDTFSTMKFLHKTQLFFLFIFETAKQCN